MTIRRYIGTLQRHQTDHHGLFNFELVGGDLGGMSRANAMYRTCQTLGRVTPQDYGKRCYLMGDVVQVENDEQRDARGSK